MLKNRISFFYLVFFHRHRRFKRQQGTGGTIFILFYHFHPLTNTQAFRILSLFNAALNLIQFWVMLYSNVLSKLMYKCIKKVPVTVVKTEFLKHFSKQMSVYFLFLYISVRMSLFQRHSKILSSGGGGGVWGEAK